MAGFINWGNFDNSTEFTDAITERENALAPVEFDSNSWTNIALSKQLAIKPAEPTEYDKRRSFLQEATERNKAILGDKLAQDAQKRDELLIASGVDAQRVNENRQVQTDIKNRSSLERIQNHIASKADPMNKSSFFDEDLENAIHNLTSNEVIDLYSDKPELRDYILSQKGYAGNVLARTGLYTDNSASVFNNLSSTGLGAASEEATLLDWANYTAKALTGSSEKDKNEALVNGISQSLSDLSDEKRNTAARLSDEAVNARNELTDLEYDKKIAQQKINGFRGTEIKQNSIERDLSKLGDMVSDKYQITKEIAQEVPSTALSLGVAKGVTSGVKQTAKSLAKDKIENHLAKKESQYVAEQQAKTKLSEEAIKESSDFAKAQKVAKKNIDAVFARKANKHSGKVLLGWETLSTGVQNAVPSYSDSASFILNQDDKSFTGSKAFKDLQKDNSNITTEEAKEIVANKAGEEAMLRTFFATAPLGALFSKAERKLFDRLFKNQSLATLKERAKSYGVSVGTNSVQEFGEEASSKLFSNLAINNALGYEAVDAKKDVISSGLFGAVVGAGATTATNAPELVGKGLAKTAKVAGDKLAKVAQKSTEKMNQKAVEKEAEENKSLFGTSSYTDKDGNFVEGQKGVLGKSFDKSNLGESYKKAIDILENSSDVLKEVINKHGKENYTQVVHALYQGYSNARTALENPDKLSKEQVEAYTALKNSYEAFQKEIGLGVNKDLADYNQELHTAITEMNTVVANAKSTNEEHEQALTKVQDLIGKDEGFQKLLNSSLYNMLSSEFNEAHKEVKDLPREVSFLDGKDKKDYPTVYNSVANFVKQISQDHSAGKITEEEAYKRYGDALTAIHALKDTEATAQEKLQGIKNLLNQMNDSLSGIGKDFGDSSPYKALLNEINKWTPSESTKDYSPDDVFLQKFFGSQGVGAYSKGYKLGLLDYVTDFLNAKKQGTQFKSLGKLQRFYNTQINKLTALNKMIHQMEKDNANGELKDSYSYDSKFTTLKGEKNKFTSLESAKRYRDYVMGEMDSFHNIIQSLLMGTARNHTKPKDKTSVPTNTNTEELNDLQNSEPKGTEVKSLRTKDGKSVATVEMVTDNSLKSLAGTSTKDNKRIVKLRENITKEDFDNYIQGKDNSEISAQKQIVFNQLENNYGFTKDNLDNLIQDYADRFLEGNTERAIKRFVIEHELSHAENLEKDSEIYKKAKANSPEHYLEDAEVLKVELRANVDAIEALGNRLGLGSNIEEISSALNPQEENKETEPEILLGLPHYEDTEESSEVTLLDLQKRNYENTKSHLMHSFAEMNDATILKKYGDLSKDKIYKVEVPTNEVYKTDKGNKFTSIKNGMLTVHLPETIAKELIKHGFDVEQNSFDKFVQVNKDHIPALSDEAVNAMVSSKITDFSSQEGRDNRDVIGATINDGTFDHTTGDNALFVESLIPIVKQVYTFFKGNQAGVFNRHNRRGFSKNSEADPLPRFTAFNFLTNLFGITYSGKQARINLPEKVIQAFTVAIPKGIINAENTHFHGDLGSMLAEKGKAIVSIYNITAEVKTKYSSQIERTEQNKEHSTSAISGTKREFIKDLGNNVFDALGLKTTNNTSMKQEEVMKFSLGLEAYNFMLNNGIIQEYIVDAYDVSSGVTETQTYFGFTWNNSKLLSPEDYNDMRLLRGNIAKMDEDAYVKASESLNKKFNSPIFSSVLGLLRTSHSEAANAVFGDTELLHGVSLSNLQDEIGKAPEKGVKAENKHGKTKLTTGKNDVLKDALQTANSVAFVPDENAFSLYDNHPEFYKVLNGGIPSTVDVDKLPITEESKDALRSRQLRIDRDFRLIDTYRGMALAQGIPTLKDTVFRFTHTLATNSRIMFISDLNPVESKPVREMLNPVEFTLSEDENGYVTVQGTITPTFSVNEIKTENGESKPRTFEDLVDIANSNSKQSNDAKGFVLALAQALGVKVEKKMFNHIVESTAKEIIKHQDMIDALWNAQQQGKDYKPDLDMAYRFYNSNGTGSSRLMKALMAFGQFQYQNVEGKDNQFGKAKRGDLEFHLYLEADGIANGFYNILKQFSTEISPAYVKAQKRTGNITLDILAQNLGKVDELEGSRTLFDTYNLDDMYQHIAKTMHTSITKNIETLSKALNQADGDALIKEILPHFLNVKSSAHLANVIGLGQEKANRYYAKNGVNILDIPELETLRKNVNKTLGKYFKGDEFFEKAKEISKGLKTINTYGQIILLGGVNLEELNKINSLLLKGNLNALSSENIPAFKRGLAKLGVTPAMYGGKLKGVTNQILTNLKPQLLGSLDKVMSLVDAVNKEPSAENWQALKSKFNEARAFALLLGIPSELFTKNNVHVSTDYSKAIYNEDSEALRKYTKVINKELNNITDYYNNNKKQINNIVSKGLGSFLNNAIQDQFEEHFRSIEFTMNLNQSLFNVFMSEFTIKINTFIAERNKSKGFTELQGSTGITRKEVIQLMKQMKNVPIVGTAFSSNSELIDSLVDLGNTLLKTEGTVELDNSTNISSNFANRVSSSSAKSDQVRVYHEGTNFKAAGASINTASVPSTEAMTLNLVQKAMNRVGKAFLNVFDGLDAKFQIRDEVGLGANKDTFDVHTNTHLLEAMFQMFNRTSFEDLMSTDNDSNFKDAPLAWNMLASMVNAVNKNGKEDDYLAAEVSNVLYYTQEYLDYRNKARLSKLPVKSYEDFFKSEYKDDKDQLDAALESGSFNKELLVQYFGDFLDENLKGNHTPKDLYKAVLSATLRKYKDMVAKNYAIRQLENNDLPVIVNQFGGSNIGYAHNIDLLKSDNGVASRFNQFIEGKDVSTQDNLSEELSEFIKSDTELQSKLNQYKNEKLEELTLNIPMDASGLNVSKLKDVKTLLNFLQNYIPKTTLQSSTAHAVGHLAKYLSSLNPDSKIYTDLNEFIEKAKEVFHVDMDSNSGKKFINSISIETGGKYLEGVGIYVHPDATLKEVVHELLHSMTRSKFATYYSNQRYRLSFGEKQAIKNIEANARKFTKRMLLEPEVMDAVDALRKASIEDKKFFSDVGSTVDNTYRKYAPAKATAINLQYAFEVLPTIDGMSEANILKFQEAVMHEFVSYGLTEADVLRELKFNSGVAITGTFKGKDTGISKRIVDSLRNYYNYLSGEMAMVMGLNTSNDSTKSALFNILTSLNFLAEATLYPNRFEIDTLAGSKESNRIRQRNDALNRTEFLIDSNGVAYPEVLNSVSLFGNSSEHTARLKELTDNLRSAVRTEYQNTPDIGILYNPADSEAQELISNIRSSGLRITQDEENAFILAYATNKVAMLGNKTLEQAGYKWLEDLSQILEPSVLGLSQKDFNRVVNPMRSTPNKLSYMLALVATNEDIRNKLQNYYKAKPTTFKNKVKQSLAYTATYSKQLANSDFTTGADILMDSVKAFDLKDFRSVEQKENQYKALELKQEKLNQVARMLGDLTDSKHVETLVKAMQSGQGTSPFHDDMDSVFTEAMNEWINTYEKNVGRRTWIGTLVRLVVGSTSKTYKWYKAKNQNSTLLESVREKATTAIPKGIMDKFNNLTKADKKAIDAVLLPTNLHKVKNFAGVQDKELIGLLTNPKNVDFEKAKVSGYIRGELMTKFGDKEGERLYNIAMWQIKGLGSLMVTKQAKTSNIRESHYIMPNTRAISKLIGNTDHSVQEAIDTLASIYALDYVDAKDKAQIADLMTREPEAFNEMLDSVHTMYAKSLEKEPSSLVGEDGFVMNHRDPMSNVKIVEPNDTETLSDLRKRGYLEKAKLPTGHLVMATNMDDSVRFTTGMFNLTESSIMGTNLSTMLSLNSKALRENKGNMQIPAKILMAAGINENYYDSLEQDTTKRIVIDHDGSIIDTAIDLPRALENQFIPSTENGIEAIGNYFGRVIEEETNISSNQHAVDLLRQQYTNKVSDRKYYVPFDGNFKPKANDVKSVKLAKEMNDIYKSLPAKTKQYIESTGGVMVDMREVENILGYHQASLSDLWNDRSRLPEPMQKVIRGVFEVMAGTVGYNPVKLAVSTEKGANELASFTKDIILNRSVFIPVGNILSNIAHLWTASVPAKHIVPDIKEGLQLAKDYQATSNKIAQYEFLLLNHKLQPNERAKVTNELQVLKEKLVKSPIKLLVDNGIFNSVTNIDIGSDADIEFNLFNRFRNKTDLTKLESTVEDSIGKKYVDNALIRKGSATHNFMVQTLDYGDFVAKYTLYKHLTLRKGVDKTNAMEVIRDEFVNYTMNRGREFDWTNKVGLTWFLAYKLSIQKVIFRNLRRNFLRTLATYSIGKAIPDTKLLDKTVIEQNLLFDSSLDYQLSPSNIVDGWEQYIWHNLL